MTNAIRHQIRTLQQGGDLPSLKMYCRELLLREEDAFVRGCLLWNLSDVYAIRREADMLYKNHRRFEAHLQTMPPMYRLWLVCDSTQRLTLEVGGYDDFWWDIYEEATANYNLACEAALFEVHRAAFYKSSKMPYDPDRAIWVKDRFSSFLEQAHHSPSTAFYRLIYTALCVKHFGEAEQDLFTCCKPFFADLSSRDEEPIYALGEWDAINCHRSRRTQAQIGINNAINALIDSGDVKRARELYTTACKQGLHTDSYIEQRL